MDEWHKAKERLQKAKPGDTVLLYHQAGLMPVVTKILRVTDTQILVPWGKTEARYRKRDGRQVGASPWDSGYIEIATPEKLQEAQDQIRALELRKEVEFLTTQKLRPSNLRNMSPELLESIREFLSDLPSTPLM